MAWILSNVILFFVLNQLVLLLLFIIQTVIVAKIEVYLKSHSICLERMWQVSQEANGETWPPQLPTGKINIGSLKNTQIFQLPYMVRHSASGKQMHSTDWLQRAKIRWWPLNVRHFSANQVRQKQCQCNNNNNNMIFYGAESFLMSWWIFSFNKFFAFCVTRSSLPSSQEPATCPYPEPDESSPHPPTIFLSHIWNIFQYFSVTRDFGK
jgi:hypothetical protein